MRRIIVKLTRIVLIRFIFMVRMVMIKLIILTRTVMMRIKSVGCCVCRVGFHPCAATQCYNYMATLLPPSYTIKRRRRR